MPSAPKAAQGGSSQAAPAPGSSGRSVWQFTPGKIKEGTYSAMISETLLFHLEAGADLGVLQHQPPRDEDPALAVHQLCLPTSPTPASSSLPFGVVSHKVEQAGLQDHLLVSGNYRARSSASSHPLKSQDEADSPINLAHASHLGFLKTFNELNMIFQCKTLRSWLYPVIHPPSSASSQRLCTKLLLPPPQN